MLTGEHRLGEATSPEGKIGQWSFRHYEHGSVYSHPSVGTKEIPGPIRDYWIKGLVHKLGFPTSDVMDAEIAGRPVLVMDFEHGKIYWDTVTNTLVNVKALDPDALWRAIAPSLFGAWSMPFEEGVVGIHVALLHTNEVLFWTYRDTLGDHQHEGVTAQNGEWSLLSLSTGKQVIKKQISQRNQFCAGQCLLGDGNVLVVGGDRDRPLNDRTVHLYNPTTRTWKDLPDLPVGRYYPTMVSIGGTQGLVVGGAEATEGIPHYRNQTAQYVSKTGDLDNLHEFDADLKNLDPSVYPFVFVLSDAKLCVHLAYKTRILNLILNALDFDSSLKLNAVDHTSRTYPREGTAVLLPLRPNDTPPYRARIMVIGGGNGPEPTVAKNTCEILDLGVPTPQWKAAKSMKHPRVMPDSVLLPDGKVLVINGSETGQSDGGKTPVYAAELYDPKSDQWTTLAEMSMDRLYHATALLLPDARVMSAGTDREWNPQGYDYAHTQLEVFSPPYLFHGPRPAIQWAPDSVAYNTTFEVATDDAKAIKSAVLIRNGSCTHSFNSDQRFVELEIKKRLAKKLWVRWSKQQVSSWFGSFTFSWPAEVFASTGLELQAPPNGFVAPEGYYMLFLLSNGDVPSEAKFIRLQS